MGQLLPPPQKTNNPFLRKKYHYSTKSKKRDPLSLGGGICSPSASKLKQDISVKGFFQQQMMFERFYAGKFCFQLKLRRPVSWVEMTEAVIHI